MGFDSWSLRDKIIIIWGLSIATLAVIFICVSLGNLIGDNSSNISGWVQAIGSIFAIYSGYYVAQYQLKKTLENQLNISKEQSRIIQREKYLRLAFMVSEVSANAKAVIPNILSRPNLLLVAKSNFNELVRQLKEFDIKDLPSPIWMTEIIALKNHVILVSSTISSDPNEDELAQIENFLNFQNKRLIHRSSQLAKDLLELAAKISTEDEKISDMNGVAAMANRQISNPVNVGDIANAALAKSLEAAQQVQSVKPS